MAASSFHDLYASDLQSIYALWVAPAALLAYLAVRRPRGAGGVAPTEARFVRAFVVAFGLETILDPLATGPLVRALPAGGAAAAALPLAFVLLGDLRVLLPCCWLGLGPRRRGRSVGLAAGLTLLVPAASWLVDRWVRATLGPPPGQLLWLTYELGFVALAGALRLAWLPRRAAAIGPAAAAYVGALLAYAAAYYALWALADLLILAGLDAGWALRMVPNQLYYSLFLPFAYARFFSARYAATSSAAHAPR